MENSILEKAMHLRHSLHVNAELSGKEWESKKILIDFFKRYTSFLIFEDNDSPFFYAAHIYDKKLPTICFRADLDAVNIDEEIALPYQSKNKDISHKCGHDGHCSTLAALALMLDKKPIKNKNIILLFQHAEETGVGAKDVCNSKFIKTHNITEIYSYHNIPGYERGKILICPEVFACSSKGIKVELKGKPTHAAYPKNGVNPSYAISEIIQFLNYLHIINSFKGMVLSTIVYISTGMKNFGTAAAEGEIWITLRAQNENELLLAQEQIETFIKQKSFENKLIPIITYSDEFPETRNHLENINNIQKSAKTLSYKTEIMKNPFKWSEDFGYYLKETKGAMFGIGAGECHPQLHTKDYDFPDALIEIGANLMYQLIESQI